MSAPGPDEAAPAEEVQPTAADPAAIAGAVTVATQPIVVPAGLVVLGGADAPGCTDGGCW